MTNIWKVYEVELKMLGRFAAALPKAREEIKKMLENRMPAKLPADYIPIEELADIVLQEVAPSEAEGVEEELKFGWATFPRNEDGLYYEGRCVRGHIKDCANQVKDVDIPALKKLSKKKGSEDMEQITALKAKVANKVYVMSDIIPLMVNGAQAREVAGTVQRFIQVMTMKGPRSTIKFVDYLEEPVLTFRLDVLGDDVITEDILNAIFEYGAIHGMGQERSQGWGRYQYKLREVM